MIVFYFQNKICADIKQSAAQAAADTAVQQNIALMLFAVLILGKRSDESTLIDLFDQRIYHRLCKFRHRCRSAHPVPLAVLDDKTKPETVIHRRNICLYGILAVRLLGDPD